MKSEDIGAGLFSQIITKGAETERHSSKQSIKKLGSFNTINVDKSEENDVILNLTKEARLKKSDYETETTIVRLNPHEEK